MTRAATREEKECFLVSALSGSITDVENISLIDSPEEEIPGLDSRTPFPMSRRRDSTLRWNCVTMALMPLMALVQPL